MDRQRDAAAPLAQLPDSRPIESDRWPAPAPRTGAAPLVARERAIVDREVGDPRTS